MKKFIAFLIVLSMTFTMIVSCGKIKSTSIDIEDQWIEYADGKTFTYEPNGNKITIRGLENLIEITYVSTYVEGDYTSTVSCYASFRYGDISTFYGTVKYEQDMNSEYPTYVDAVYSISSISRTIEGFKIKDGEYTSFSSNWRKENEIYEGIEINFNLMMGEFVVHIPSKFIDTVL